MREKQQQKMRIWAMLCHLSAVVAWMLLVFLIVIGIPLYLPLNILLPLIIWRVKKAEDPWIDFQGKESLNFQLSTTVYSLIVMMILLFMVFTTCGVAVTNNLTSQQLETIFSSLVTVLLLLIGFIILLQLILVSLAAIKAYKGQHYRYPLTIRFLR